MADKSASPRNADDRYTISRKPLWLSAAGMIALAFTSGPVAAQTTDEFDIVVTAQRRATLLQETPVAVTAMTADTLQSLGASDMEDVARYVPGLMIQQTTFQGASPPAIRGVGSFSLVPSASFPVAFYYDGQFHDRPFGTAARLFDIERVEVLRGPQGVLFGRNATAGAIRIDHALPSDSLTMLLRASSGSFNQNEIQASIRGPVAEGVALGIAGIHAQSDGYGRNRFNGQDIYGYTVTGLRGSAVFTPTDDMRLIFRASDRLEQSTTGFKQIFGFASHDDALFNHPVLGVNEVANNLPGRNKRRVQSASGEVQYSFASFDLFGMAGWNQYDQASDSDTDGGDQVLVVRPTSIFNRSRVAYEGRSTEWRISSTGWDNFRLDAGVYYIREIQDDAGSDLRFISSAGVMTSGSISQVAIAETNAYAVFTHGALDLTDRLTLRAGVRYSYEEKEYDSQVLNLVTSVVSPLQSTSDDWTAITPLVGVDYRFTDDVFAYFTASQGFKSGGFATDPGTGNFLSFDPEYVWNYEIGLKTDLFGNRLRFNNAIFYMDYQDLQVTQNLPAGGAITTNAASATIYGLETELVLRPTSNFTLTGAFAWLHAEYDDYQYIPIGAAGTPQGFNMSGYRLDRAPEYKGSLVAEYVFNTSWGALALQGAYSYEDSVFFQSVPDSPVALAGPPASPAFERSRYYERGAIELFDARVQLTLPDQHWSLALYGSNLADERYFGATNRLGGGTSAVGVVNEPRAFRFEISYRN